MKALETEMVNLQNRYCMGRGSAILSHAGEPVPLTRSRMAAWSLASTTFKPAKMPGMDALQVQPLDTT